MDDSVDCDVLCESTKHEYRNVLITRFNEMTGGRCRAEVNWNSGRVMMDERNDNSHSYSRMQSHRDLLNSVRIRSTSSETAFPRALM